MSNRGWRHRRHGTLPKEVTHVHAPNSTDALIGAFGFAPAPPPPPPARPAPPRPPPPFSIITGQRLPAMPDHPPPLRETRSISRPPRLSARRRSPQPPIPQPPVVTPPPPDTSDGPPILRPILFIFEGGFLLSVFMYEHVKLGDLFEAYAQHIRRRRSHLAFFSRGIRFRERWYNRPLEDFRIFLTHAYDNQHCVVDVFTLPIDFDPDEDSEEDEVILTISGHDLMIEVE
jgi:hypothetical protein